MLRWWPVLRLIEGILELSTDTAIFSYIFRPSPSGRGAGGEGKYRIISASVLTKRSQQRSSRSQVAAWERDKFYLSVLPQPPS